MIKDNYGQEINEGDWIAAPLPGSAEMAIGKVVGFTKNGNPRFKQSSKGASQTCMLKTVYYSRGKIIKEAKFVKILPTKEIDLYYEHH